MDTIRLPSSSSPPATLHNIFVGHKALFFAELLKSELFNPNGSWAAFEKAKYVAWISKHCQPSEI